VTDPYSARIVLDVYAPHFRRWKRHASHVASDEGQRKIDGERDRLAKAGYRTRAYLLFRDGSAISLGDTPELVEPSQDVR
jgi:hypothetical protein